MAEVVHTEDVAPDPARPPLQVTIGRDDQGLYTSKMAFGGINAYAAAALLVEHVTVILQQLGDRFHVSVTELLSTGLWLHVPEDERPPVKPGTPRCPDCGQHHG